MLRSAYNLLILSLAATDMLTGTDIKYILNIGRNTI